jgi:hypothetical protein
MILQICAVLILGLMCGSELNVAAFAHPAISRQPMETEVRVRATLAESFGSVMPFWMSGSALLNLLLLFPLAGLGPTAWRLAAIAFGIQVLAVLFSLAGPVPINNRIRRWSLESLPKDWRAQEHRWDVYHWLRTSGLVGAFAILIFSLVLR